MIQNCDLTMANAKYDCKLTDMTTTDGCPLAEGTLRTVITLKPLAQLCHNMKVKNFALDEKYSLGSYLFVFKPKIDLLIALFSPLRQNIEL